MLEVINVVIALVQDILLVTFIMTLLY